LFWGQLHPAQRSSRNNNNNKKKPQTKQKRHHTKLKKKKIKLRVAVNSLAPKISNFWIIPNSHCNQGHLQALPNPSKQT